MALCVKQEISLPRFRLPPHYDLSTHSLTGAKVDVSPIEGGGCISTGVIQRLFNDPLGLFFWNSSRPTSRKKVKTVVIGGEKGNVTSYWSKWLSRAAGRMRQPGDRYSKDSHNSLAAKNRVGLPTSPLKQKYSHVHTA